VSTREPLTEREVRAADRHGRPRSPVNSIREQELIQEIVALRQSLASDEAGLRELLRQRDNANVKVGELERRLREVDAEPDDLLSRAAQGVREREARRQPPKPGAILYDEGAPTAYLADEVTIAEVLDPVWEQIDRPFRVVLDWRKLRWTTPEELADPERLYELFGDHEQDGIDTSVVYTRVEDEEPDAHLYVTLKPDPECPCLDDHTSWCPHYNVDGSLKTVARPSGEVDERDNWTCMSCGAISEAQSCRGCGAECRPGRWVTAEHAEHEHGLLLKERDDSEPGSLAYQVKDLAGRLEHAERLHVDQQAQVLEVATAESDRAKAAEARLAEARAALEWYATGAIDCGERARAARVRIQSGEETQ
jgi:hypothetical protein